MRRACLREVVLCGLDGVGALIERAEAAGLRLYPRGDTLQIVGPEEAAPLVEELRQRKAEALVRLAKDHCARCGYRTDYLVATYWTQWQQGLCPDCVAQVVEEFDQHDTWPDFPVPDEPPVGETP